MSEFIRLYYESPNAEPDYLAAMLGVVIDNRPGDYFWVWIMNEWTRPQSPLQGVLARAKSPVASVLVKLLDATTV